MPRRYRDPFFGERFVADTSNLVVHDCDNEVPGEDGCLIGNIAREDGLAFDDAAEARAALAADHRPCPHCLGNEDPDDDRPGRYASLGARPIRP